MTYDEESYKKGKQDGMTEEAIGCHDHCKQVEKETIEKCIKTLEEIPDENEDSHNFEDRREAVGSNMRKRKSLEALRSLLPTKE